MIRHTGCNQRIRTVKHLRRISHDPLSGIFIEEDIRCDILPGIQTVYRFGKRPSAVLIPLFRGNLQLLSFIFIINRVEIKINCLLFGRYLEFRLLRIQHKTIPCSRFHDFILTDIKS